MPGRITHMVLKHKVWVNGKKQMSQIMVRCGAAKAEDQLTYDSSSVTCFDCLLAMENPRVLHLQLFADGLPIPEVQRKLLGNRE
jgi:hypothetical protein